MVKRYEVDRARHADGSPIEFSDPMTMVMAYDYDALEADKADLLRVLDIADQRIKALEAALVEAMDWDWLTDPR